MRNPTLIMVLFALLLHCSVSQLDLSSQKVPGRARIELPLIFSHGNGLYNVKLDVGGVGYYLALDTGSSLPWIQCAGTHVKPAFNLPYNPRNNRVSKRDPECPNHSRSAPPNDLCDFHIRYFDGGSCSGIMIRDNVQLYDRDSSRILNAHLVLGCGEFFPRRNLDLQTLYFDGILGLDKTRSSFTSLLVSHGLANNVFGHCLGRSSRREEYSGYVFFGNGGASQSSNDVLWLPMKQSQHESLRYKYIIGPAILNVVGAHQGRRLPSIMLDSGSTYTTFDSPTYTYIKDMIQLNLDQSGAPLRLVRQSRYALPVCWDTDQEINLSRYFMPIKLEFGRNMIIVFQMRDYTRKMSRREICLSILENNSASLNMLGAYSMMDRLVIYDNEGNRLGWSEHTTCMYRHHTATDLVTGALESVPTNVSSNAVHGTMHD